MDTGFRNRSCSTLGVPSLLRCENFRMPAQIAILDDDHVIRLTRYAISGPGEITEAWAREFFMPEDVEPARVFLLGSGLHEVDGVSLIPMAAKLELWQGTEATLDRKSTRLN